MNLGVTFSVSLHLHTLDEARQRFAFCFNQLQYLNVSWQSSDAIISCPRGIKIHKNNYPLYDWGEFIIYGNIISNSTLPLEARQRCIITAER